MPLTHKLRLLLLALCLWGSVACNPWSREIPAEMSFIVAEPKATFGLSGLELIRALKEADRTWRRTCTQHSFPVLRFRLSADREPVGRDGKNVIRVLTGRFCPDSARDSIDCYEPRRAAITHIYPPLDGAQADFVSRMPEMDVELNAADFRWKELGHEKLMAVLVHELGHVFGLKHSCAFPSCNDEAQRSVMDPYLLDARRPTLTAPTQEDCRALPRAR